MIPRRLHYCWFGGQPMNPLVLRCLESWRRVLPAYSIREWNETNSPLDVPYCRAAHSDGQWSRLSNYVRLHAVREEGGIYLDTDMEVLRSLDTLLGHRCFIAFQQEPESTDWVNTAAFGAEARHPFLDRCLEAIVRTFERDGVFPRQPPVTTAVLRGMGLVHYGRQECGDVSLLPHETFYPFPWYERFKPSCVTLDTYAIHHWEMSWHSTPLAKAIHALRCWRQSVTVRLGSLLGSRGVGRRPRRLDGP